MYCTSCGTKNGDVARFCQSRERPGAALALNAGPPPYVPNDLPQATLVSTFCCSPLGIVSILHTTQENGNTPDRRHPVGSAGVCQPQNMGVGTVRSRVARVALFEVLIIADVGLGSL